MNTHQILKNDEAASRNDSASAGDNNLEVALEAPQSQSVPNCKNGVCHVNWKPQRA